MANSDSPRCGARLLKRGGNCTLPAGWGTSHVGYGRCRKHFGNAPNAIAAAENERVTTQARRLLEGITEFEAVTDPVVRLQLLAGRAEKFMQVTGDLVAQLTELRYDGLSGEQLRAEVAVYERAMLTAARILVDLAKLGLDERAQRISEQTARLVHGIILGALADAGLDEATREAVRPAIARRLRLAAAAERGHVTSAVAALTA
jgi:hypothetical protein